MKTTSLWFCSLMVVLNLLMFLDLILTKWRSLWLAIPSLQNSMLLDSEVDMMPSYCLLSPILELRRVPSNISNLLLRLTKQWKLFRASLVRIILALRGSMTKRKKRFFSKVRMIHLPMKGHGKARLLFKWVSKILKKFAQISKSESSKGKQNRYLAYKLSLKNSRTTLKWSRTPSKLSVLSSRRSLTSLPLKSVQRSMLKSSLPPPITTERHLIRFQRRFSSSRSWRESLSLLRLVTWVNISIHLVGFWAKTSLVSSTMNRLPISTPLLIEMSQERLCLRNSIREPANQFLSLMKLLRR